MPPNNSFDFNSPGNPGKGFDQGFNPNASGGGGGNKKPKRNKGGYTVQSGDNPALIAQNVYGNQRYLDIVLAALGNKSLTAGMVLNLPDLSGYQKDLAAKGQLHEVSQGEWNAAKDFTSRTRYGAANGITSPYAQASQTQPPPIIPLQNPPGTQGATSSNPSTTFPGQPSGPYAPLSNNQYTGYIPPSQGGGYKPTTVYPKTSPVTPTFPYAGGIQSVKPWAPPSRFNPLEDLKTGQKGQRRQNQTTSNGATTPAQPPLQGQNPAQPGGATGYYTGVGMPSYPSGLPSAQGPVSYANPAYYGRPVNTDAGGRPRAPEGPAILNNPLAPGMTGSQQAAAIEQDLYARSEAAKPKDTYQIQRGVYQPIYNTAGQVVGYNVLPTGETINTSGYPGFDVVQQADGTWVRVPRNTPAAYVGWIGGRQGLWSESGNRVIGGGEGYPDYLPNSPPRPVGTPTGGGSGGGGTGYNPSGGGGSGGGGGGGNPGGYTGRGVSQRYQPPVYAQGSTMPGGARNPARSMANLSRTQLVTWRLS